MSVFQAIVLGVLQGLAEFLPISSSAHLSLAPWFFGWRDPGLAFDVALHVGTLVALLWYFRAEWIRLARAALSIAATRRVDGDDERRVIFLIIATIPGAIAGLLLNDYAETVFRTPLLTAGALVVMGALLWAVDRAARRQRSLNGMRWDGALLIGLSQMFALIPGVSRSGATITAGRALRFDRQSAATFSFLMSMPITAAAAVVKVPEVLRDGGLNVALIAGVFSAAVSSWIAITVLLRYVSRHSFGVFALYRVVLGAIVVLTYFARA